MALFWQYRQFTDLNTFLNAIEVYLLSFRIGSVLDIDKAKGFSLDMLGKIVNVDRRPVVLSTQGSTWNQFLWNDENWNTSTEVNDILAPMSDVNFRKLLTMRKNQLLSARTLDNLLESIILILPNIIFTYIEEANKVTINYQSDSISFEERQILNGGFLLTPQGTNLIINEI